MKKIVLIITMGLTFFVACNDEDLLDKTPHSPSDNSFYITMSGATQGLMAAYSVMQLGESVEKIDIGITSCTGDAMVGGEPGGTDEMDLQNMMRFSTTPSTGRLGSFWNSFYMGIYRCNLLLSYLEKKDKLLDFPKGNDDLINQLKGEVLFLRGFYHFRLQVIFGGYPQLQPVFNGELKGVPFIDKVLSNTADWIQKRPPLDTTWSRIAQDFLQASKLLKNRNEYPPEYLGRATKGAALAMLGKTYLFQDKFAEAYPILKEVINSGQYQLLGEDGTKYTVSRTTKEGTVPVQMVGFKYRAQPEANNSVEAIFDVQHRADHSANWPEPMQGSIVARHYGPRRIFIHNDTINGPVVSFLLNFWSFVVPTTYFVETAYKNVGCDPAELDPRFKLTVYGPNDSIPYIYPDPTMRRMYPDSVKNDAFCNWPSTGYLTWTYFVDPIFNDVRTTLGDMPLNTRHVHFNDLLLMGAEAAVHTNNNEDALLWINRVRTRARNSGNTGYPENYTGTVTLDQVYAERRVELAFEHQEFYTLVRTQRIEQVLKDAYQEKYRTITTSRGTEPQQFGDNFRSGKNEIFPVPQSEVDLSGGALEQNPGGW
jgi:hypothetical protein